MNPRRSVLLALSSPWTVSEKNSVLLVPSVTLAMLEQVAPG